MTEHADAIRAVQAPQGWAWALIALVTAVGALTILAPLASAGGTAVHPKSCGSYTGPRWSVSGHSGTHYAVYAVRGASCSLALAWAARLSRQKPRGTCAQSGGKVFGWAPSAG